MLNKDLVGKLSPEQQEIFAQMEFRKTKRRLKLEELARGKDWRSRWFPFFIFGGMLACFALSYFGRNQIHDQPAIMLLPLGILLIFILVFHITRTNRRLDALLELMALDREEAANGK